MKYPVEGLSSSLRRRMNEHRGVFYPRQAEDNNKFPPKHSVKNTSISSEFLSQLIKQKFESVTNTATCLANLANKSN
jgi:hypothetical protein